MRVPFWGVAGDASVDGDTAIVGLMARHPFRGTTMWGQPYGSPLDGWAAAPFVAALGPTPAAVRTPYALLSLTLVAAAWLLGERLRTGAGRAAALLVACPPAYVLLLSALPPPLYPTTLVLLAGVLLLAADAAEGLESGRTSPGRLALLGALGGLALWTHLMSLATLAAAGLVLARSAWRARTARTLAWAIVPLLLASAPWWVRALRDPSAREVLGIAHEGAAPLAHAKAVAARLHVPSAAMLGTWSPLTADEAERTVRGPVLARTVLVAGWLVLALAGATTRGRPLAVMAWGSIVLTIAAFPFPVRSDPHTVRFLTPLLLPMAALAGAGAVRLAGAARGWLVVLPVCAAHLSTGALLLHAWRSAGAAALVPDCAAVLATLRARQVTHAYASYHTAYCLTYTSGEAVVAAPPWNERFYGYPQPYLDAVRATPRAAWVLVPGVDFGLPAPHTFETKVAGIGGRYTRLEAGPGVAYLDFVPPFAARAEAGLVAGPAGDGDIATRVTEPPSGAVFALGRAPAVAGVTLLAGASPPWLPRSMDLEVSSDGATFERIGRRRRGRETVDLAWLNGHPQYLVDDLAFSVPLDGRRVTAVRVVPTEGTPWAVSEVLVHPVPPPGDETPAAPASDAAALFRTLLAARRR